MIKCFSKFNPLFVLRIILGGIFIYSGVFKVSSSTQFIEAIKNYDIVPDYLVNIISLTFPWIEIALGLLLILNIFIKYVSLFSTILLAFFIFLTVRGTFIGLSSDCGCFPESSLLNSKNPIFLILRNYLFLSIAIYLSINKSVINRKQHNINNIYQKTFIAILVALSATMAITIIGKRKYENSYIQANIMDRKEVIEILSKLNNEDFTESEMINIDSEYHNNINDNKLYLLIILNSFDCQLCMEEAIYVEQIKNKYANKIKAFGIVGHIGNTAITSIKKRYGITYDLIVNENIDILKKYSMIKTLKLLVNKRGEILVVHPPTYNIKVLQNEFEEIISNN